MQVRLGWSGEIEPNVWRKADIGLDDNDLNRMLIEADVPTHVGPAPVWLTTELSTKVCFQLLQNEAEILLMKKLMTLGYPADKASDKIIALEAENNHILAALKAKYQKVPA